MVMRSKRVPFGGRAALVNASNNVRLPLTETRWEANSGREARKPARMTPLLMFMMTFH
jgi:hypothetical protein